MTAEKPEAVSSICAVLAETDVINMVSRGLGAANILRGIHDSMAGRFARLLHSLGVEGTVFLSGGLAADDGLAAALAARARAGRGPGSGADRAGAPSAVGVRRGDRGGDLGSFPPAEGRHGGSRMDGERDDLKIRTLTLGRPAASGPDGPRAHRPEPHGLVRRQAPAGPRGLGREDLAGRARWTASSSARCSGSLHYGEFGQPEPIAVLDTILVDPGYRAARRRHGPPRGPHPQPPGARDRAAAHRGRLGRARSRPIPRDPGIRAGAPLRSRAPPRDRRGLRPAQGAETDSRVGVRMSRGISRSAPP